MMTWRPSRHREQLGHREREYDRWRNGLQQRIPFVQVAYIEASRTAAQVGRDWPIFDIHCIVAPLVLARHDSLEAQKVEDFIVAKSAELQVYRHVARQLGIPLYCAVADYELQRFLVRRATTMPGEVAQPVQEVNAQQYAEQVIGQHWLPTPGPRDALDRETDLTMRYSKWHRWALTSRDYMVDIDYLELHEGRPKAMIEATRANPTHGADIPKLWKGLSDFFSRGFYQLGVSLQIAEALEIPYYVVVYEGNVDTSANSKLLGVRVTRDIVVLADPMDRQRATVVRQLEDQGKSRSHAMGLACSHIYDQYRDQLKETVETAGFREWSRSTHEKWLEKLGGR
jgi:hypothetical protein